MAYRHWNNTARDRRWSARLTTTLSMVILCSAMVLLSSCSGVSLPNLFYKPSKSGHSQDNIASPTGTTSAAKPSPTVGTVNVTFEGTVNCPANLNVNWDHVIGTRAGVDKVQKVTCGSLEGAGSLTALVNVRSYSADAKLDVYVYDSITTTPAQRFNVRGLVGGDAQISPGGTLMTAEILSNGIPGSAPNVFKEYQWNGNGFSQIIFPGIYPDMTHYQAEQSQTLVNQGKLLDRTSGFPIVNSLASRVFHWTDVTDQTITYDSRTATYIVQCTNNAAGGGGFIAHLFRLDNNTNGIFEIMQVTPLDTGTTLASPTNNAQLTNPIHASGNALAKSSTLGEALVYDNLYTIVGNSGTIHSATSGGYVAFNTTVSYHLGGHGQQEAVFAFYSTYQNSVNLSNQVALAKVLLTS